jgi:hypothetical protein
MQTNGLALELWRDYDETASLLPGMSLGEAELSADPADAAAELFERGVRRVTLRDVVDLTACSDAKQSVYTLAAIAEFTGAGMVPDWRLRLGETGESLTLQMLSHLYPPAELISTRGEQAVLQEWISTFIIGKLAYRCGPGFVQVRDSRWGAIRYLTIDKPSQLAAIDKMRNGAHADDVPIRVLNSFLAYHLIGRLGDLVWWLPYRRRRWPDAA